MPLRMYVSVCYIGPLCGQLAASDKHMLVNSSEVTVHFVSGTHRSGRGFLLSYTTNQHPGITNWLFSNLIVKIFSHSSL